MRELAASSVGPATLTRAGRQFLLFQFFQDELIEISYRQVRDVDFKIALFFLFQFLEDDTIEFPDGKVRCVKYAIASRATDTVIQHNPHCVAARTHVNVFHDVASLYLNVKGPGRQLVDTTSHVAFSPLMEQKL